MIRALLTRGLLAGLIAGALAFGTARIVGEPQIKRAIAYEAYVETHVHHEAPEPAMVSRSIQSSAGLGTGAILYGVALGGVFALVFAIAYARLGPVTARGTAAALGLLGFVSIYLVPVGKYPANPPSIGNADTIGRRTGLYLLMIVLSVAALLIAVAARRRLLSRFGDWNATIVVAGGYVLAIVLCYALLPGIDETPQQAIRGVASAVTGAGVTFPPTVLWRFRVASLVVQGVMWTTIALTFGSLAERLLTQYQDYP